VAITLIDLCAAKFTITAKVLWAELAVNAISNALTILCT
jgi:hypothetical protein